MPLYSAGAAPNTESQNAERRREGGRGGRERGGGGERGEEGEGEVKQVDRELIQVSKKSHKDRETDKYVKPQKDSGAEMKRRVT